MSQKSTVTTTSFIISSDESLNKPPLSSSQSTDSGDNMTASDSVQNNQYFVSLNPVNSINNNMVLNQQNRLHSSMLPLHQPPPTSYSSQEPLYGPPAGVSIDGVPTNTTQHPQFSQITNLNNNQCNGNSDTTSMIYAIYNQNNLGSTKSTSDSRTTTNVENVNLQQIQPQFKPYTSDNNDRRSTPNIVSSNGASAQLNQNRNINGTNQQHQQNNTYQLIKNGTYSAKSLSNFSVQSFHNNKQVTSGQRSSISSLDSSASNSLMPINVKGMLLHGVANNEVIRNWLTSIKCEEYVKNFIDNGYDMQLLTRMTPQDLTAIGCKSPALRKKLLVEIKKLNLEDDIPECRPHSLEQWLELLKLSEYYVRLCEEGYDTIDKVCELTWEDLEEIGINKLGHQKRLLLGIERVQRFDKQQEERQNDYAIYDVHPNHRISLHQNNSDNRLSTLGRSTVRSGFFQTRSGANLDHRGLPVATVMPALKHVNNSLANLDISHQVISKTTDDDKGVTNSNNTQNTNGHGNIRLSTNDQNKPEYALKMNDSTATMKRNPPPLPPVRTNSLKITQDSSGHLNNNSIYGNNYSISQNNGAIYGPISTGSTSFLRTPKLGTLTPTTNKMLTHGGHIQSVTSLQATTTVRSIVPVREAPLPPIPLSQPPNIPEKIEEEPSLSVNNIVTNVNGGVGSSTTLINPSLIGHQLASADEFPPPPPSQ